MKKWTEKMKSSVASMNFLRRGSILAFLAISGVGHVAHAADLAVEPVQDEIAPEAVRDWEFVLGLYGWLPWISGETQTGPVVTDFDLTASDILDALRFAVFADAEIIYQNRFTGFIDYAYSNLAGAQSAQGNRSVKIALDQTILEGRLGYRMLGDEQTWLEAYAGARYWDIGVQLNVFGPIIGSLSGQGSVQWVDPIIGLRGRYTFHPNWALIGQGDIGGFGAGSEFSWRLQGGIQRTFENGWAIDVQYKALSVDYDNGEPGAQKFVYDAIQQGPLARVSYRF